MNLIIYLQIKSGFYQETEIIKIAKIVKEVVLVKDLIKAINELPNCPNGHSDVYDKNRIMYMVKTTPSRYVELDVEETR